MKYITISDLSELCKYKEFLQRAHALCVHQPLFNLNKETPCYFILKQLNTTSRVIDDIIDINIARDKTSNDVYAVEAASHVNMPRHM